MPKLRKGELAAGAYLTDGKRLYEVIERDKQDVVLENCKTGNYVKLRVWRCQDDYSLVRKAPEAPDFPPKPSRSSSTA